MIPKEKQRTEGLWRQTLHLKTMESLGFPSSQFSAHCCNPSHGFKIPFRAFVSGLVSSLSSVSQKLQNIDIFFGVGVRFVLFCFVLRWLMQLE